MKFEPLKMIAVPIVYAYMTMCPAQILMRIMGMEGKSIPEMVIYTVVWGAGYFTVFTVLGGIRISDRKTSLKIVESAQ